MDNDVAAMGMGLGCCFVGVLIFLAIYLFSSYCLYRIGLKFGVGSFIEYCVPIYNIYLLTQCAQITPLWIIAFFLPVVSIAAAVYLWGTLAARLGKDFWLWGLLVAFLGLPVLFLAFDDSMPVADPVLPFE